MYYILCVAIKMYDDLRHNRIIMSAACDESIEYVCCLHTTSSHPRVMCQAAISKWHYNIRA